MAGDISVFQNDGFSLADAIARESSSKVPENPFSKRDSFAGHFPRAGWLKNYSIPSILL